jgi:hypothetical protein
MRRQDEGRLERSSSLGVMTAPIAAQQARAARGRWIRRLVIAFLLAIITALATVLAWLMLTYRQFESQLKASHERLPGAVASQLTPADDVLDRPQLTLVAPFVSESVRLAPILFRTDPDRQLMAFLSLPPARTTADPNLIRRVSRSVNTPVNHAALVSLPELAELVDALGGIAVHNPSPADGLLPGGHSWHFPAGDLRLDGEHAEVFLRASSGTTAPIHQQIVLEGIVRALLSPSSLSDLSTKARAMTASMATDLTASQVLSLAWLRFHSRFLLHCDVAIADRSGGRLSGAALEAFLGQTAVTPDRVPDGCQLTQLRVPSIPLPPKSVVRAVAISYPRLSQVAVWTVAAVALFVVAWLVFRGRRSIAAWILALASRTWEWIPRRKRGTIAHRRGPPLSLRLRAPSIGPRSPFFRPLTRWVVQQRGEIGFYLFAIASSASVALLVLRLI